MPADPRAAVDGLLTVIALAGIPEVRPGDDLLVAEGTSATATSVEPGTSVEAATSAGAGTQRGGGDAA